MRTIFTTFILLFVLNISGQNINVSGLVTDGYNMPVDGATVFNKNTAKGTITDFDGNYEIAGRIGHELEFRYTGMTTVAVTIRNAAPINITLEQNPEEIGVVIIKALGKPIRETVAPYAISTLTPDDISNAQGDIVRNMAGKIPGVTIIPISGALGAGNKFNIRSMSSITGNNDPLFVVDGVPFNTGTNDLSGFAGGGVITTNRALDLDPNNIAEVQVLRGLSATVLYGQDGRNGVVLITTKSGSFSNKQLAPDMPYSARFLAEQERIRTKLAAERTAMELGYRSEFQPVIKDIVISDDRYSTYLNAQKQNGSDPAFYLDIFDRFEKIDDEFAAQVLESYVKVKSDDPALLKALAFKLEEQKMYADAVTIYTKLKSLLPNDPQSIRDLALAYQRAGKAKESLNEFQALKSSGSQELDEIIANEVNNLLVNNRLLIYENFGLAPSAVGAIENDMRIVVDWNRADTNLDLQVIDPNLEACNTENIKTRAGGFLLSNDVAGFGPEVYQIHKIQTGSYYIKISPGGEEEATLDNPAYVKLTVFRNYGRSNQTQEVKVVRVSEKEKLQLMDRIAVL